MHLRPYQQIAVDLTLAWLEANKGNPCIVMPTGSGKSHVVAALCKHTIQTWPDTRVLMLTHVKELIEQNVEKMRQHWPAAPLGIFSAGLNKKQLSEPITFAGIQSIQKRADDVGHVDLVVIDECDLVSHKDEGGYRTFLAALLAINPAMRVVGLTATPYRMGHGYIIEEPALFHALIEPVTIEQLLYLGHLSPLRAKRTKLKYDTTGVHKRGGDFIESELQKVVDTDDQNHAVVKEILEHAGDRKAWLLFCTGVDHSLHVAAVLRAHGVPTETVTGDTPKNERARILADFRAGKVRAVTNALVLTTGFDYPAIDLIAMLRPTASTRLFMQMCGRGMRPHEGKENCLVLDFAGVVATLGPVTNPTVPGKAGDGDAPVKVCEVCHELCHISAKVCPACGTPFPEPIKDTLPTPTILVETDIMGLDLGDRYDLEIESWRWHVGRGVKSGKDQIVVTYYGTALSDAPVTEYLCINHDGYAADKAWRTLILIAQHVGPLPAGALASENPAVIVDAMNAAIPPAWIQHTREGRFQRITKRHWV